MGMHPSLSHRFCHEPREMHSHINFLSPTFSPKPTQARDRCWLATAEMNEQLFLNMMCPM